MNTKKQWAILSQSNKKIYKTFNNLILYSLYWRKIIFQHNKILSMGNVCSIIVQKKEVWNLFKRF